MDNALDISKIAVITTFVFSIIRTTPEVMDLDKFLRDIKDYYLKEIQDWDYEEFMRIFKDSCPRGTYEEFKEQDVFLSQAIPIPTDNVFMFSVFRSVFSNLFDHALSLNTQSKTKQLKDFFNVIHCLPEALLWKNKWHSRDFWNLRIKEYCKRWNVKFPGMRKYFFRFFILNKRGYFRIRVLCFFIHIAKRLPEICWTQTCLPTAAIIR